MSVPDNVFGRLAQKYREVAAVLRGHPVAWARDRRERREAAIHRLEHELALVRLDLKDLREANEAIAGELNAAREELELSELDLEDADGDRAALELELDERSAD